VSPRLRSKLTWKRVTPSAPASLKLKETPGLRGLSREAPALIAQADEKPGFDTPDAPRESAIKLLHIGAEIEHALMVQYLYAAYSLDENQASPERRARVGRWRATIAEIAREEMGHLATVQNILTLIGGPLCFEREDYPIVDPDLWPFPFELEALTKDALAKYVLAEMPSDEVLAKLHLTEEIAAIKKRLAWSEHVSVNRVGKIYGAILELFTAGPMIQGPPVKDVTNEHPFVPVADIQADSLPYQVSPNAWGLGYKQVLIDTAVDRSSALEALTKLSVQGEGPITADDQNIAKEFEASHFRRFLEIYREFPEASDWSPARNVAKNPTIDRDVADESRVVEGAAARWAALANLRYRMLLLYLAHSFYIETPSLHPTRSPRSALVSWAFGEMYNLRSLSEILMTQPLRPGSALMAGPPFEMPYTLSLSTRSTNRWRAHRDLLLAAEALIDQMLRTAPSHERYLRALRAADATAREQIEVLVGA
jgi:hypothetical protein